MGGNGLAFTIRITASIAKKKTAISIYIFLTFKNYKLITIQ